MNTDQKEQLNDVLKDGESKLRNAICDAEKRLKQGQDQVVKVASDIDKQVKDNPWPVRAVCAFATLYLLLPIDTIPDFIPIFGYLDDFLVIFGVVMWVINRRKNMPLQP